MTCAPPPHPPTPRTAGGPLGASCRTSAISIDGKGGEYNGGVGGEEAGLGDGLLNYLGCERERIQKGKLH